MTDVSPEALAQAREQLKAEGWKTDWIANFAAYAEQRALLNTERATVIELRRQLAEMQGGLRCKQCHQRIVGSMTSIAPWWCSSDCRDRDDIYLSAERARTELATERQRAEAAEQRLELLQQNGEEALRHIRAVASGKDTP